MSDNLTIVLTPPRRGVICLVEEGRSVTKRTPEFVDGMIKRMKEHLEPELFKALQAAARGSAGGRIRWRKVKEELEAEAGVEKAKGTAEDESESEQIRENRKTPAALKAHPFKRARWTHKNGHPRCLLCGMEEPIGGKCEAFKKAEDLGKPFPNEHAARQRDPGDFEDGSFRRKDVGGGVSGIFGRLKGEDTMSIQSIRFDVGTFTPEQARAWLPAHDYSAADFEEATGGKSAHKGKMIKAEEARQNITVVVMEPGRLDTAKEWVSPATIAKAMDGFMKAPEFCINHGTPEKPAPLAKGWLVESFQTDRQLSAFRGATFAPPLREGAWIATWHMTDAKQWGMAKAGGISGPSIEGHPEEGGGYELVPGSPPPK